MTLAGNFQPALAQVHARDAHEEEIEFRDPGDPPVLDWLDKDVIDIDRTYQRELDEPRVQRILDWFDWRNFGALVVAPDGDGRYHCIDGQHRLEAAKRHPKVTVVPAVVIQQAETVQEAETFVAVNKDRKNVTPLQLYWAELAANDPEAVTVSQVCARAEISIVRSPGGGTWTKPGDTVAIGAIKSLVARRGAMRSRQMLEVLGKAHLKPVTALQIKAVEVLMTESEFAEADAEALTEAITGKALVLEDEARAFAVTHRVPLAKAHASVWFKRCRKRRKVAA